MGGLPDETPMGPWRPWWGGGRVGLSWGRGVGTLAEAEDEGEQRPPGSEGELVEDVEGARAELVAGPPGEGALRRRSVIGAPQDSGVSICTPPLHSALPSQEAPWPGL